MKELSHKLQNSEEYYAQKNRTNMVKNFHHKPFFNLQTWKFFKKVEKRKKKRLRIDG